MPSGPRRIIKVRHNRLPSRFRLGRKAFDSITGEHTYERLLVEDLQGNLVLPRNLDSDENKDDSPPFPTRR